MSKSKTTRRQQWEKLNRRMVRCQKCPRLIEHCRTIASEKRKAYIDEKYWGRPVENMGFSHKKLLIVGLAPGAHGANRTGRMFTGDRSADWLFRALHRVGFASQAESTSRSDGLKLERCAVTAICHCAPPDNKPTATEIANCQDFFKETVELSNPKVFLALGKLAFDRTARYCAQNDWLEGSGTTETKPKSQRMPRFKHGQTVPLKRARWIVASYHPSQQNTFTGRLTEVMLDEIMYKVTRLIE